MNTPVSLPLAKLLKEKGFDEQTDKYYVQVFQDTFKLTRHKLWEMDEESGFQNAPHFSAPTIADVVMWFYEKHGIWIMVEMTGSKKFYPRGRMIDKKGKHHVGDFKYNNERLIYNSPTEAYEAAIEYTLNNLI